ALDCFHALLERLTAQGAQWDLERLKQRRRVHDKRHGCRRLTASHHRTRGLPHRSAPSSVSSRSTSAGADSSRLGRGPRTWTEGAITSVVRCCVPSWAVHCLACKRPSAKTRRPFAKYSPANFACEPNTTSVWYSVRSCQLVATLNVPTWPPFAVRRT